MTAPSSMRITAEVLERYPEFRRLGYEVVQKVLLRQMV